LNRKQSSRHASKETLQKIRKYRLSFVRIFGRSNHMAMILATHRGIAVQSAKIDRGKPTIRRLGLIIRVAVLICFR
jgi:hypothetical protein